jgi:hypothetical protein
VRLHALPDEDGRGGSSQQKLLNQTCRSNRAARHQRRRGRPLPRLGVGSGTSEIHGQIKARGNLTGAACVHDSSDEVRAPEDHSTIVPRTGLGRELLHPLPIGAVALLVLNDQILKGSGVLPGWLTGKLSDVTGLFFFPILLFVALDLLSARRLARPPWRALAVAAAAAATIVGFSAVKLSPAANAWVGRLWGPMVLDPSDLLALPFAILGGLWIRRAPRAWLDGQGAFDRALRLAAFVATALASIATPAPRLPRNYPAWSVEGLGARRLGCAHVDLWVSKSGKQGFGLTVALQPGEPKSSECRVELRSARFDAPGVHVAGRPLPVAARVDRPRYLYLSFPFDNESLWNEKKREGKLELVLVIGGDIERLTLPMRHIWVSAHVPLEAPGGPPAPDVPREPLVPQAPRPVPPFAQPPPDEAFEPLAADAGQIPP